MIDGHEHLDPPIEVTRHPVGRADEVQRLAVVAMTEADDPGVLEVTTEDRTDPNVLTHAGHAGAQAADPAHDEIDLHSGVAGGVERLHHLRVADRVQLGSDTPFAGEAGLAPAAV